ncbi:hypothetical protein ACWEVD_11015 [Nocardia thailandica]|uniref:Uncharacterized protein n=1 Tax=Nocardia thailandica TaxID=257275 RepID=A0ABW6PIC4_9NOCA|nr:hypothetical protein [Nocardia thailandica]
MHGLIVCAVVIAVLLMVVGVVKVASNPGGNAGKRRPEPARVNSTERV